MVQARDSLLGRQVHLVATGPRRVPSWKSRLLTCSRPLRIWRDLQKRVINPALQLGRSKLESITPDTQKRFALDLDGEVY
jgi:hypothetical protein